MGRAGHIITRITIKVRHLSRLPDSRVRLRRRGPGAATRNECVRQRANAVSWETVGGLGLVSQAADFFG